MLSKKNKALVAGTLAAAMTLSSVVSSLAGAASSNGSYEKYGKPGQRTKTEAFGDSTYAERFMSLYDDVMTKGGQNGYLSTKNYGKAGASGSFGVPYHSIETLMVEAPDYGHVTTSEAMSYIVWVAAMHDNLAKSGAVSGTTTGDYAKAWNTMESMIPGFGPYGMQKSLFSRSELSATYSNEYATPEEYDHALGEDGNTGKNPLFAGFKSSYGSDPGYYLMHWLADVDDWYGFGGSTPGEADKGPFTFINTFQRGEQESVWETVPHPSVENQLFGSTGSNGTGIKGAFDKGAPNVATWSYTNAPDAEDRALQAVYAANKWGVGTSSVTTLAGKMGDQLRNDMFDKYYKEIGCTGKSSPDAGLKGEHFLRAWYSAWGGDQAGTWAWQIGASHMHQFYQNPLAAYGLLYDADLAAGMKSSGAKADYEESFKRQIEFYLWLQSADGPIAGGCTNSWNGRYETAPAGTPKFYKMSFIQHPVYMDPPSNNWIGNQLWSVQRLCELYYYVKTDGDKYGKTIGGLSLEDALDTIISKWLNWFLSEVELNADGSYSIPATVAWTGQPGADWSGTYNASTNANLHAVADNWGDGDIGCIASLANSCIYYAKAKGVTAASASALTSHTGSGDSATRGLYMAKELIDRLWKYGRDDVGVTRPSTNESFTRLFEQTVFIVQANGAMPSGAKLEPGATFLSLRPMYKDDIDYPRLEAEYKSTNATKNTAFTYHRFWHEGDMLMALGAMASLYPDMSVGGATPTPTEPSQPTTNVTPATKLGDVNVDGSVTIEDVVKLRLYLLNAAKYPVTAAGLANAQVKSGTTTISAAHPTIIQDYIVGQIATLPN